MIEVIIDSIRVSLMSQYRIVILKDTNSDRYLPIWIGPCEADAITTELQEMPPQRYRIGTATGADALIPFENLFAKVAGIRPQLPFVDARIAAEGQTPPRHLAAAPAARTPLARHPPARLRATCAHTRRS